MKPIIKAVCLLAALMLCAGCAAPASGGGLIEVNFYLNDGTQDVFTQISGQPGSAVFMPGGAPSREGYMFGGWFLDKDGKQAYSGTASENSSVYAFWAQPCAITFAGEGAQDTPPQSVPAGSLLMPPPEPVREGYFFSGWFTDTALTSQWDFMTQTVQGDMTLYAGWGGVAHMITLHLGEGMTEPFPVAGPLTAPPEPPLRDGYSFGGWFMDEAYTVAWDFGVDTILGDMDLYAKWDALAPGETPAPTKAPESKPKPTKTPAPSTPKPTAAPTSKPAGVTPTPTPTSPVSASSFTVAFDSGGGSTLGSYVAVPSGAYISKPADPVRSGYTFVGWYKEATLVTQWNFSLDRVSGNMTLYARWTLGISVSFNTNGGSSVAAYTNVPYNSKISAPTAPTKNGFTFVRWYKEQTLTSAWDFGNDKVTSNITLYAMWAEAQDVTVTYDPTGGESTPEAKTVKAGESVTLPSAPARSGYTFLGWYTAKSGGSLAGGAGMGYKPTASITLYAKWESAATPSPAPTATATPSPSPEPSPSAEQSKEPRSE